MKKILLSLLSILFTANVVVAQPTTTGPLALESSNSDVIIGAGSGRGIYGSVGGTRVLACVGAGCTLSAISLTGDITYAGNPSLIVANTSDAADNKRVCVSGGGACANTRGARLELRGNELGSGYAQLASGDAGGDLYLDTSTTGGSVYLRPNGDSSNAWVVANPGNLIGTSTSAVVRSNTSDAADNKNMCVTAGGACDAVGSFTRGGKLYLGGNEDATNAGQALLHGSGVVQLRSNANQVILRTDSAQSIDFLTNGAQAWSMGSTGTLVGSGTATIGWAVVDGTDNTACSSQCTAPAVFGFNLAAGATAPVIVGPSDATADICLCAGAS